MKEAMMLEAQFLLTWSLDSWQDWITRFWPPGHMCAR